MPIDPAGTLNEIGEALIDLAEKFRECAARQQHLVDWHQENP